ncbi:MAG: ABC transporter ATP-binding protein [Verrucomicrobiae bacterium]|nr:ABC transporter ATP-binding protein [Verrucomicrobiae bacterium]
MITVEQLSIRQGAFRLESVSFVVPTGQYAVLMGRTGSGKTTVLEAIAGLRRIHGGRVILAGRDVTCEKPGARNLGYVPQDGALFTSMTVRANLGFALSIRRWPREKINARVSELAGLLGITHLLDRRVFGLSGGEAQRVALGRALAAHPPVLLLDEPLSALDEDTRNEMYGLLKSVRARTGVTALHVTHSPADAERLADVVFRLRDGKIAS